MDIREIRKLIRLMKEHELTEFELQDAGLRITLKRAGEPPAPVSSAAVAPAAPDAPASAAEPAEDPEEGLVTIRAPIVGTFYRSASPELESFVKVDDAVEADTVCCIIEAMKVMNEIQSEVAGRIHKILVENATPVEFGQPLFLVRPE